MAIAILNMSPATPPIIAPTMAALLDLPSQLSHGLLPSGLPPLPVKRRFPGLYLDSIQIHSAVESVDITNERICEAAVTTAPMVGVA